MFTSENDMQPAARQRHAALTHSNYQKSHKITCTTFMCDIYDKSSWTKVCVWVWKGWGDFHVCPRVSLR